MLDYQPLKAYCNECGCAYTENEPLKEHTTFKIGGNADIFLTPVSEEILLNILEICRQGQIPVYCIGSGSNLLVSDFGFHGAVIRMSGFDEITPLDGCAISCGAGVKLSRVCSFAFENSLTGLEFAWGIPGSVGGAVFMNAGAYGGEMKNVLVSAKYITPDGETGEMSAEDMKLGYRTSAFEKNKYIITSAVIRLQPGFQNEIREKMDDLIGRRKAKQPLDYPSAGSTFKRPEGNFAGTLIEQCGLKGEKIGGAMVSDKHAGFIINADGKATCSDVIRLIERIKNTVFQQTGIQLEAEVRIVKN